ncbi:MAG: hypothetical protein O2971_14495 [Proteobacteria bacterium]|nr:hypothetical protein [Pseudomonadota bacterium]
MKRLLRNLVFSGLSGALTVACAATQPRNIADVCDIFEDRRSWYRAAKSSERRWGIPIEVNMAFIYQESSFQARAKPERTRLLWIFPGPRPSSAFGYAQALDSTWDDYVVAANNKGASRRNFDDAIDFVAWYNANSNRISKIERRDARNLYYAYHEGNGGYQRGTYRGKQWLVDAANRVQSNSQRFSSQLAQCRRELDKNWFQRLIS